MRMTVFGTGYLGATHAACMAELGHEVLGVDVDAVKVDRLCRGEVPFFEPGLPEILSRHVESGRLRFTTDYAEAAEFADLLTWLGEELEDEVKQVRLSHRLTESAACMVGDEFDMTPQLEAMYRASGMELPTSKRILELNPSHPLVERLRRQHAEDPSADGLAETARRHSGAAGLAEGRTLADPAAFAKLLVDRI